MKEMILFAGVNGSGKSTLYKGFELDYDYLNTDIIALNLGDQHDSVVQFKAFSNF